MLKRLPRAVLGRMRDLSRRWQFEAALKAFMRDPRAAAAQPGSLFDRLVAGWGNPAWSGQSEYLRACVEQALACDGPILECGSGLTTLLVGVVAQGRGQALWTLEHLPEWSLRVQRALDRHGLHAVQVCTCPLRSYGDFDWYEAPLARMPEGFALIICDGPPARTRGGRYGLAPVMASRMLPGCRILLDDAERSDEQRIATRWASELGLRLDRRGVDKPFFALESAS